MLAVVLGCGLGLTLWAVWSRGFDGVSEMSECRCERSSEMYERCWRDEWMNEWGAFDVSAGDDFSISLRPKWRLCCYVYISSNSRSTLMKFLEMFDRNIVIKCEEVARSLRVQTTHPLSQFVGDVFVGLLDVSQSHPCFKYFLHLSCISHPWGRYYIKPASKW